MLTILASFLFAGASLSLVAWIAFQSERERLKESHIDYNEQQATMARASVQDMRQPLNSIAGLVNGLQTSLRKASIGQDDVSGKLDLSLRELNEALQRALAVFELADDDRDLHLSPIDIRTEIKLLIRKRNKNLLKAKSDVKVVAGYIPEFWIETDLDRFSECIGVLLDQAIAQTKEGNIRVTVATEEQRNGQYRVAVAVKDNGRGMDQRRARSFFNPVEYEDNPELRGLPASMLSLNLAARSATRLGGSMMAKSCVGIGTTFIFSMRANSCAPVEDQCADTDRTGRSFEHPNFDQLSVLLVDDNEINLFVLQEFVIPLGFGRVVTAGGGQKAIERALAEPFDLILMDLAMPSVDGFAAAARIREGGPSESAPIIAVSGMPISADSADLKKAGIDGFVPKPVVNGDLLAAILSVLEDAMRHADERKAAGGILLRVRLSLIRVTHGVFKNTEDCREKVTVD
ncbi:MAG: response regulator, partial [Pseudomonadota bacterium]